MEENMPPVDEPKAIFKLISDRTILHVVNADTENVLVEFSGYDLQINFNMEYINSVEEVEAAVNGVGDLFRQIIMEKLLEHKKQNKPDTSIH